MRIKRVFLKTIPPYSFRNRGRYIVWFSTVLVLVTAWPWPVCGKMTAEHVAEAIERKIQSGATARTLWNMGYIYYHQYGATKAMAKVLHEAYQNVSSENKGQDDALRLAADHWRDNYQYWGRNKPGDKNNRLKDDYIWKFAGQWESNLKVFPTGDQRYRPEASFIRRRDNAGWDTTLKMYAPRSRPGDRLR